MRSRRTWAPYASRLCSQKMAGERKC